MISIDMACYWLTFAAMAEWVSPDLKNIEIPSDGSVAREGEAGGVQIDRIIIQAITPMIENGRYAIKRVLGEPVVVEADVFRDGHETIRAVLKYRRDDDAGFSELPMLPIGDDRWRGEFIPSQLGTYRFTIEAWTDVFASWSSDFRKKLEAGRDIQSDLLEGVVLVESMRRCADATDVAHFNRLHEMLLDGSRDYAEALNFAARSELSAAMARSSLRHDATIYDPPLPVLVDHPKACFSAWYELFVRSQTDQSHRSGTFRDVIRILPEIADMGFDVLYLTPIHPIGVTNRKGPNNSLLGGHGAVGSPWAIGNGCGGHDAIEPSLGTLEDFKQLTLAARRLGLEIALDFALQCSPDHPWVRNHPEWFRHRLDGTIKYAENPPKEYQDIFPLDFDNADRSNLMREILRVVLFWIDHGVRIFRVDNPHTKPILFWKWLIEQVRLKHPDVLFLAEAFTRPKVMKTLAAVGFNQSYTYFTWRNSKSELIAYLTELTQTSMKEYYRPNFFTNTPDILPTILQTGNHAAFKMRLTLAATLSSNYGIYSGFEYYEAEALPGTEEYRDSEKYEIKVRYPNRGDNLKEYITAINRIRRTNPALQQPFNLRFLETDDDNILFYAKSSPSDRNLVFVAVNLDPFTTHECTGIVPPDVVASSAEGRYQVTELLSNVSYTWSERNYIQLDPSVQPAQIFRVDG